MNWEYNYLIILCKLLKQQLRVVLAVKGNWLPIPIEDTLAYIVSVDRTILHMICNDYTLYISTFILAKKVHFNYVVV
jgi:hypothetical protein